MGFGKGFCSGLSSAWVTAASVRPTTSRTLSGAGGSLRSGPVAQAVRHHGHRREYHGSTAAVRRGSLPMPATSSSKKAATLFPSMSLLTRGSVIVWSPMRSARSGTTRREGRAAGAGPGRLVCRRDTPRPGRRCPGPQALAGSGAAPHSVVCVLVDVPDRFIRCVLAVPWGRFTRWARGVERFGACTALPVVLACGLTTAAHSVRSERWQAASALRPGGNRLRDRFLGAASVDRLPPPHSVEPCRSVRRAWRSASSPSWRPSGCL